jgi:acyl-CoA synthetase (AMP-forming)/AMP-acid ligase II
MPEFRHIIAGHLESRAEASWLTLISGHRSTPYTFRQVAERTYDYCAFYRAAGVAENDTVVIILRESLDLVAAFFAGIVCGALPAFYFYPSPKQSVDVFLASIDTLLLHNEVKLIVSYPEVIGALKDHHRISVPEFVGFFETSEVPVLGRSNLDDFPAPLHEAFLQFSSGTTGAKKGVKISTTALLNQVRAYGGFVHYAPGDAVVSWLPHYHDMGLIACILMPFVLGVPVYMMSPFEWVMHPQLLLDWLARIAGTHVWLPNFALGHLARSCADDAGRYDLSSVKHLVCCSEPVLKATVDDFVTTFSASGITPDRFQNCYAMAENTFAMTSTRQGPIRFLTVDQELFRQEHRVRPSGEGRPVASAGVPLPNIRVQIRSDAGEVLPEDHVGEILIHSDCMLDSYHNNWEETQRAMMDGWFRTGDLGFFHDGELYVTGRSKEMLIIGGENIYPQDIEAILNSKDYLIPGRNVAFGVENAKTGTERLVILAEARAEHLHIDLLPLRTEIMSALGVSVSRVALLPHRTLLKGTAGKISRFLNKQAYLEGRFDRHSGKA